MSRPSLLLTPEPERCNGSTSAGHLDTPKRPWFRILRRMGPAMAAAVLTLICLTIPRAPVTIDRESSWGAVLSHAHETGLRFGTQIVFTHGPLGFLTFPYFTSRGAGARMACDLALCFVISLGVSLVAWRLQVIWRCLFLALFIFFAANVDLSLDLLLDFGLVCWALLCWISSERLLGACLSCFVILALFAGLAKLTFLCTATICLLAVVCNLALRGQSKLAFCTLLGAVAGLGLTWLMLGQKFANLGPFLINALVVSKAYHDALPTEGPLSDTSTGLVVMLLGLAAIIARSIAALESPPKNIRWRRGLLLAWMGSLLFLSWKHAFVRADRYHVAVFLSFIPLLTLGLGILPSSIAALGRVASAFAVASSLLSLSTLQSIIFPGNLNASLRRPPQLFVANLRSLLHPARHLRQMNQFLETERSHAQLPRLRQEIGPATVDVFGSHLSYALFNELNYRPRPVFQSYVACSAPLMRLNEQFFQSRQAPEYVLFRLDPIDHKFPPLEDALLLRHLLINYQLVDTEDGFLLLKAQFHAPARLTLLREGIVHHSEKIGLADFRGSDLWMEIFLEPSFRGRVTDFVYHLSAVRLAAWSSPEPSVLSLRAPASMLAAGFVASPLIVTNQNVVSIYKGESIIRPAAYSVEVSRPVQALWQPTIRFRVYRIENKLGSQRHTEP